MPLSRANPASPLLGDWTATVDAITSTNQVGTASGITAHSGGGQTLATKLSQSAPLVQVDTVAADHDSVLLPPAIPGANFVVVNNGAHILDVYPQGTDTISASTSPNSLNANVGASYACAKSGNWGVV